MVPTYILGRVSSTRPAVAKLLFQHHRCLSSSSPSSLPSVKLFQYAICPFCHKAKAVLHYIGIKHEIVEVNPLTKVELPKEGNYRKVPIAVIDDEQINGSDEIVAKLLDHPTVQTHLQSHQWQATDMTMERFRQGDDWQVFAREQVASLLYPNICPTLGDSYQSFGYVEHVSTWSPFQKLSIRTVGSLAMFMAASRVKKKKGIDDEQQALREALDSWYNDALDRDAHAFASGTSVPNLADLTLYGTLRSVEGLAAHDKFVLSSPIQNWYNRMRRQVLEGGQ